MNDAALDRAYSAPGLLVDDFRNIVDYHRPRLGGSIRPVMVGWSRRQEGVCSFRV
jgi:hypothetical protein